MRRGNQLDMGGERDEGLLGHCLGQLRRWRLFPMDTNKGGRRERGSFVDTLCLR